ncbi:unnamed protein product [Rotaria sp. Silwood2]|nr:unnamed protein product [Rotaria sp. Silwood2]CAF2531321.1 unnamed protein product [Rotaria sp. Silwood2]CAF2767010.1 unnamed protein product [Rotaria sp. Silwood2]CAF4360060.1 unnamed protein product [Rotaria sp. Silwood2]CAF4363061.1 unnamed protein product [Rotaria sp. Silwood2]
MTEHIDITLVENNLRHRFEYLSKFINFTGDDIAILNAVGTLAASLIPIIRHFGFTDSVTVNKFELTLESEQMVFHRKILCKYLTRILRQKFWNDAFLEYLADVGNIHTKIAGSHSIDINYIHIIILFTYVEHILLDTVLSNQQIDK